MCDPVTVGLSVLGGVVGAKAMTPKASGASAAAMPDPAKDQADIEARAVNAANAKLANDQQRRRQQQSLLAKGAPAAVTGPTLGDQPGTDTMASPLSGGSMNRSSAAQRTQSLLARGATASGGPAAPASVPRASMSGGMVR